MVEKQPSSEKITIHNNLDLTNSTFKAQKEISSIKEEEPVLSGDHQILSQIPSQIDSRNPELDHKSNSVQENKISKKNSSQKLIKFYEQIQEEGSVSEIVSESLQSSFDDDDEPGFKSKSSRITKSQKIEGGRGRTMMFLED